MSKSKKFLCISFGAGIFLTCSFLFMASFVRSQEGINQNIIYPYLQNVTTNGIEISWSSLASSSGGKVFYGLTSSYDLTAPETIEPVVAVPRKIWVHKIIITGLNAKTKYYFKITDSSGLASVDSTFLTAPVDGAPFSFLVYGDVAGNQDSPRTALYTIAENEANAMVLHNPQTVAFMLGDHTNTGYYDEWQPQFFLPERNLLKNTVVYNILGNHDTYGDGKIAFANYFDAPASSNSAGPSTESYYSFNYGNVHFIVLDGNLSRAVGSEQYTWLVADMAKPSAQDADWRIILTHQPGLAYGSHGEENDSGFINAISSLDSAPGVAKNADLILMGHNHIYERNYKPQDTRRGITWITVGTTGGTPRDSIACTPAGSSCPYLQYSAPKGFGYMVISTTNQKISGVYYYTDSVGAVTANPTIKDTFTISINPIFTQKEIQKVYRFVEELKFQLNQFFGQREPASFLQEIFVITAQALNLSAFSGILMLISS